MGVFPLQKWSDSPLKPEADTPILIHRRFVNPVINPHNQGHPHINKPGFIKILNVGFGFNSKF